MESKIMETTIPTHQNEYVSGLAIKGHRRWLSTWLGQTAILLLSLAVCLLTQPLAAAAATGTFTSRNPAQDLDTLKAAGNNNPSGLWSDGTTIWVADANDDKLYAYNLATKQRDPIKDFDTLKAAGNTELKDLWSDGTTMWIANSNLDGVRDNDKIYAYKMSDKSRDAAKDFSLVAGNIRSSGLWSDGTTMWISDTADKLYAYKMSDKSRDEAKDIDINGLIGNRYIQGIWSDGTTIWAVDFNGRKADGSPKDTGHKIYAFNLSERTREAAKDFDTLSGAGNRVPRGLWSDGATMWVADSNEDKIYAYRLSDAATLSSLSLSGLSLSPTFEGGTARYTGTVFSSDIQTTVVATPLHTNAMVSISPADTDTATDGHQVALARRGAETAVTITVTPSSGTARAYTVTVANLFTARQPTQDFDALDASQNTAPRSLWSDGGTIWVTDDEDNKLYAYNLADKTRDPDKDFNTLGKAGNGGPGGLWSDGTTMWVSDHWDNKIYAYKMSDKSRDPAKDFNNLEMTGNSSPVGLWSDGTTMWVPDWRDDKIYAYKMSDKRRDPAKDFNTLAGAGDEYGVNGLWSDGTTMWMADSWQSKIYAYKLSDKSRDASKEFDTLEAAGNMAPHGLWSDGTTMWVADWETTKVYAYHLSNDAVLSSLTLSDGAELTPGFDGAIARYTVSVSYAITNLTIAAAAWHTNAVVSLSPSDADSASQGHQVALAVGTNDIAITVTPSSGLARTYTIAVRRGTFVTSRNPAQDFNTLKAAGNDDPVGLWSDGATLWISDDQDDKIYAYKMSDKIRDPAKDFDTSLLRADEHKEVRDIWSDGITMWVLDGRIKKIYAYNLKSKQRDPSKDFNTLSAAGNNSGWHLWSDGTTMWVMDYTDAKIYAYKMSDKSRDPAKDFDANILNANGNTPVSDLWSDGTTLWVADRGGTKIYAYNVASKQREPAKDFGTLVAAGNEHPRGLWSDGTTMWVSDPWDDKIYAYQQPPAPSGDNTLQALGVSQAALSPAFVAGTTRYTATVATTTAVTTVTAVANHAQASVSILPADADSATAGHQVALAEGVNPITIIVTAENGSAKNYDIAVTRRPRSGDNDLRALRLIGHALSPSFLPVTARYSAVVSHPVNLATIVATASHRDAVVSISPADADANTAGHQVVLAEGNNRVAIMVTAPNGATKDYILTIRRASIGVTGWNPLRDLALSSINTAPRGLWSDGETLWVADNQDDKLYAYNLADGRRLASSLDFNGLKAAGNDAPAGLWADGETLWVTDHQDAKLYAYNIASKGRVSTNDFALVAGNDDPAGLWADGETLWVADDGEDHVYAYRLADKRRNVREDFSLEAGNDDPAGLWADGETLWVADHQDAKLYAYRLADKRRDAARDFNTLRAAENGAPWGLWSDGTTMWVIDAAANKLYAYHAPPSGDATLRALALSGVDIGAFSSGRLRYTAGVAATNAMTTITAVANHAQASMSILPADADADAAGHQVALAEGNNPITITLTAPNRSSRTYTITLHRALSNDAALQSLALSGIPLNFSSDTTHYTAPVSHLTLSTTVQVVASDPNARLAIVPADADADTAGHQVALAEGNNTIAATVIAPNRSSRTYTITLHRALSGDVSFGALGLKPVLTFGQVTGRPTLYRATVAATTTAVTLTATAKHDKAQVVIWGEDAATTTAGHQVALTEGDNPIALAVIAANGAAQTYSIIVSRPAPALSGRQAQPRGFQTASVAKEKKESRRTKAAAFSGGVRFELVMPLTRARSGAFAVEASSRLVGGVWRLLQPEEEYRLVWKDNQDGTAHMTLTLPQANANQSFLRLKPTN